MLRPFALALVLLLAACGDEPAIDTTRIETPITGGTAAPPEPAEPYTGPPAQITLTPLGEAMRYEQTEFTVRPGQIVELTFNNTATSAAMQHNVVLLYDEASVGIVGRAASASAATDYIPEDEADRILAFTSMAAPGETVSVTFTAPLIPGDYPYICTFPGHYAMMQGVMHVREG
jgi:azurin